MEKWIELIIAVLSGLVAAIPLVVQLVKYVRTVIQEKKWNELVKMTLGFMTEAEQKYSNGADKKTLVLAMIQKSADQIGYNFDEEAESKISDLIDSICEASKIINSGVVESK